MQRKRKGGFKNQKVEIHLKMILIIYLEILRLSNEKLLEAMPTSLLSPDLSSLLAF